MKTKTSQQLLLAERRKGGRMERRAWLKHLNGFKDGTLYVADLIAWGKARKDRYRKRSGGL